MSIVSIMKNRLNIAVDEILVQQAKRYAARHQTSVSKLVEQYFKNLTRPARNKNIIQLIEKLPKPGIDTNTNLTKTYYEDQQKKHGFLIFCTCQFTIRFLRCSGSIIYLPVISFSMLLIALLFFLRW